MNWTVYCMGDLPLFRDIINAVAMVFSSSLFNPSQGAGLVVLALLLSIFFFAVPVVMNKPLSPFPFIFVFLLYFGGVVPKTTLLIQDIYTGAVTSVDNVPLIVAVPASLSASIAKGITDTVETAFSSPSQGTYLSLGAEGFVNPLKLLLSFREVGTGNGVGDELAIWQQSLDMFVRDCAVNAPGYSAQKLKTSPDMFAYLTSLPVAGVVMQYSAGIPEGYLTSCPAAAASLITELGAMTAATGAQLDTIINSTTPPRANSVGGVVAFKAAANSIVIGALGTSQDAQQFMVNMLANQTVESGLRCANQAQGALPGCRAAYFSTVSIEKANVDAAANASIFAKTAIPTMNILLALFYAFSPIVIGIAMLSAAHGIKIIGGFLMFGAWTQSWMPIAAILNYIVQLQLEGELAKFGHNGINMSNMHEFYTAISLKLGLASEMMALTPMLSMALLSGSMFALSGVANKFAEDKGSSAAGALAPDYTKTGALGEQGALMTGNAPVQRQRIDGGMGAGGVYTMANAGNDTATEIDVAGGAKASVQNAFAHRNAVATQHAHNVSANLEKAYSKARESGDTQVTEAEQKEMFAQADKKAEAITKDHSVAGGITEANKSSVSASLSAGIKFWGIGGAELEAKKAFENAKSLATTDTERAAISAAIENAKTFAESMGHKYTLSNSTKDQTALNKKYGLSDTQTDTQMSDAQAAVTRSLQQSRSIGSTQKLRSDVAGARVSQHGYNSDAFAQSARSLLSQDDKAKFETLRSRHMEQKSAALGGVELNDAQKNDATIQAMSSIGADAQLVDLLGNSGALAVDSAMLSDAVRDQGLKDLESPRELNVGDIRTSAAGLDKTLAENNARQASGNRGSSGAKYVPKVDPTTGKVIPHQFQSQTAAVQGAIAGNLAGAPASAPTFTGEQEQHHREFSDEHAKQRAGIAAAFGMALDTYDEFSQEHPYIAAAMTVLPAGRAVNMVKEYSQLQAIVKAGGKGVEMLEKDMATQAAKESVATGLPKKALSQKAVRDIVARRAGKAAAEE